MRGSIGPHGFVPAPGQGQGQAPTPRPAYEPLTRSWLARVNTCPWRECGSGCQRTRCHAGRGDPHGGTTLENCRDCLRRAARR